VEQCVHFIQFSRNKRLVRVSSSNQGQGGTSAELTPTNDTAVRSRGA
jgi:hypothetical protein